MDKEKYLSRFIWLVISFVLSIRFLIFTPSVLAFILGWDGLGLTSFLLVLYYQNYKSLGAGLVTAFINRVGDVFLLFSISFVRIRGHWALFNQRFHHLLDWVSVMFVLVAITKRAQVPFSY